VNLSSLQEFPLVQHTPAARRRPRQTGSRLRACASPSQTVRVQWSAPWFFRSFDGGTAYSCGGSPGIAPGSRFNPSVVGTRRAASMLTRPATVKQW